MLDKLVVIGAGKWGSALAHSFSKKCEVYISSRKERDLPNFIALSEAIEFKYIVIAIPTQSIPDFLKNYFVYSGQCILVASKGVDVYSRQFLHEVYQKHLPLNNLAFISGPSFASEISNNLPAAIVISSVDKFLANIFLKILPNNIKGYYSDDIIGSVIAGAYKNPLAIAAGMSDGLSLGENTRVAILTRGVVEMMRFAKYFGAKEETIYGLAGVGDLFLTGNSNNSRNYRVGRMLVDGMDIDEINRELNEIAEGITTTQALYSISKENEIFIPIVIELYRVIYKGSSIKDSISLFLR